MDAGDKDLPKLETRQWAAALRRLRGDATLVRLDFERVIERMHCQVCNAMACLPGPLPPSMAALYEFRVSLIVCNAMAVYFGFPGIAEKKGKAEAIPVGSRQQSSCGSW